MSKKEKIKELMLKFFGPASAKMVDYMGDDEDKIVAECRQKALALLGPEKAKEFDNL